MIFVSGVKRETSRRSLSAAEHSARLHLSVCLLHLLDGAKLPWFPHQHHHVALERVDAEDVNNPSRLPRPLESHRVALARLAKGLNAGSPPVPVEVEAESDRPWGS
jgi:hypothetical protein